MYTQENGTVNGTINGTANGAVNMAANGAADQTTETVAFRLPDMATNEFSPDELAEDMEGMQMSLPRVKIPGGGVTQFEMASDEPGNPDYVKYLEGVILYNHAASAYWPEGTEYDDNAVPLCSSVDGKQGTGEPGGTCATCALNRFGSGTEGRGKACSATRS